MAILSGLGRLVISWGRLARSGPAIAFGSCGDKWKDCSFDGRRREGEVTVDHTASYAHVEGWDCLLGFLADLISSTSFVPTRYQIAQYPVVTATASR